ncbi:hypothetical protein IG631_18173 [Alternaria alternata]|nr:hypothetical protein IG631_18173 [Alternaria alternata]
MSPPSSWSLRGRRSDYGKCCLLEIGNTCDIEGILTTQRSFRRVDQKTATRLVVRDDWDSPLSTRRNLYARGRTELPANQSMGASMMAALHHDWMGEWYVEPKCKNVVGVHRWHCELDFASLRSTPEIKSDTKGYVINCD